ncbi:MAG: ABC transporter ATP-binding protein [Deltaproteobacteria bacterium]|nr:ABC transporter ATP-binding protein [Deltaproteobacteria bacterium]
MPDRLLLAGLEIRAGERVLVRDGGFRVDAGEVVALVGASGSGKTLSARAVLGLPGPQPGVVAARCSVEANREVHEPWSGVSEAFATGRLARFRREVEARFRAIRGRIVGYLPQDARGALDPLWTVRRQVEEALALGRTPGRATDWLARSGFRDPASILPLYPHQLSGGMAQRVAIALALARGSRFLLADEPTSGLDPTVQAGILEEIRATSAEGVGILLITHDLRQVHRVAHRVVFMDTGRVVETLDAADMDRARSPEARALLASTARIAWRAFA